MLKLLLILQVIIYESSVCDIKVYFEGRVYQKAFLPGLEIRIDIVDGEMQTSFQLRDYKPAIKFMKI